MSHRIISYVCLALLAALVPLVGCGGSSSPTSPSGGGIVLNGMVIGSDAVSASSGDVRAQSNSSRITVTVAEDSALSAAVAANGTFVLKGLPTGTFTLVFTSAGAVNGTVRITGVRDKMKIKIVVQVSANAVSLVNLEMDDDSRDSDDPKTCLISGGRALEGIELEGNVAPGGTPTVFKIDVNGNRASKLVDVSATAASFVCNGSKGTSAECKASVTAGAKIHVRGMLTSCTLDVATVVATEVKVQKAAN